MWQSFVAKSLFSSEEVAASVNFKAVVSIGCGETSLADEEPPLVVAEEVRDEFDIVDEDEDEECVSTGSIWMESAFLLGFFAEEVLDEDVTDVLVEDEDVAVLFFVVDAGAALVFAFLAAVGAVDVWEETFDESRFNLKTIKNKI